MSFAPKHAQVRWPPGEVEVPAGGEARCPVDAVLAQLRRILASSDFDASDRNRRFLRYVVEEVLAGRTGRIKAYSVATTVFGRDSNFDPQIDAIVRIEARRLRQSLERYYLTGGKEDPVRITIPKGAYSAAFEMAGGEAVASSTPPPRHHPAILVAPFDAAGGEAAAEFAKGLTRHIVINLTRFADLRVYGPEPAGMLLDYVLKGGTLVADGRVEVDAMLQDVRTGQNVWAASLSRGVGCVDIADVRGDIANHLVRSVAEPFGAISRGDAVALFYRHWRSSSREAHEAMRQSLDETARRDPEDAEALACLSLVHSDAYEHGFDFDTGDVDRRQLALALALRAVALTPRSSRARHALSLAYWHLGDLEGSLEELRNGCSLNPNDTFALAELGLRGAFLGQWDKAVALLREACSRCPLLPAVFRIGLALFHYAHDHHEEALAEVRKAGAPHTFLGCALEAAAAGQLGRLAEARDAARRLLEFGEIAGGFAGRNMPAELIGRILDGLRKAGLAGAADRQLRTSADIVSLRHAVRRYPFHFLDDKP